MCVGTFSLFNEILTSKVTFYTLGTFFGTLCFVLLPLTGYNPNVCFPLVYEFGESLLDYLKYTLTSPQHMCLDNLLICPVEHISRTYETVHDYENRILSDKPTIIAKDDYWNNLYE